MKGRLIGLKDAGNGLKGADLGLKGPSGCPQEAFRHVKGQGRPLIGANQNLA